jgi:hypothetical protein
VVPVLGIACLDFRSRGFVAVWCARLLPSLCYASGNRVLGILDSGRGVWCSRLGLHRDGALAFDRIGTHGLGMGALGE